MPLSIANGTTAASMLPQFGVVSTSGSFERHLREQELEVDASPIAGRDDAHLAGQRIRAADAVDLPRIGRTHHGEQYAIARRESIGRSLARKNGPRDVPPRMK